MKKRETKWIIWVAKRTDVMKKRVLINGVEGRAVRAVGVGGEVEGGARGGQLGAAEAPPSLPCTT